MITRPMLAEAVENIEDIKYPILASPKLDGIRCVIVNGVALSRKFKPIPNKYVRETLSHLHLSGLDGELMIKGKDFNSIQSEIMSEEGKPDFAFMAFDFVRDDLKKPFTRRLMNLTELCVTLQSNPKFNMIETVPHRLISSYKELLAFEQECVDAGYEGIMIRSCDSPYKCGRSTLREGYLLKLKRFYDAEAEIIGFEEQMHNDNIQEENELGLSKRSSKKAGLVPAGTLGKFKVKSQDGVEFEVGTGLGLTKELRQEIWNNQSKYLGKMIKYKYQGMSKTKPRFPVWLGFRDDNDMGEP